MSVIINGDSGITDVNGTAAAPAITGTDTDTGVYFGTNTLGLSTNGTNGLYMDSSQNVGIGTTTPQKTLEVYNGQDYQIRVRNGTSAQTFDFGRNGTTGFFTFYGNQTGYTGYVWSGVDGERMRIDSSGYVLVGINSWATLTGAGSGISGTAILGGYITTRTAGTASATCMAFRNDNNQVGSIYTNGSATTYLTNSDYRLKENITAMTGALDKIAQLKPVTYNWKFDGSYGQGFIAHELQDHFPEAVGGEKDAVDEDGNILSQGIDPSKLVATLTAAIQELKAIVDAQQQEIELLKAKQ